MLRIPFTGEEQSRRRIEWVMKPVFLFISASASSSEKKWRNVSIVFCVGMIICLLLLFSSYSSYADLNNRYQHLNSRYLDLEADYNSLQTRYETLESSYSSLQNDYAILFREHTTLQGNYATLRNDYQSLQSSYSKISNDREILLNTLSSVNQSLQSLYDVISIRDPYGEECCKIVTIDDPQLRSLVQSITGGWDGTNDDFWADLSKLQEWIMSNIKYSYDTYTPSLSLTTCRLHLSLGEYVVRYPVLTPRAGSYWREEFWKFPNETLKNKHGDCEDQAILLLSMIRCYFKYCVRTLYDAYAMSISGPTETSGHMAVVIPVAGGKITILDPAGKYATGLELFLTRRITARFAEEEINDYLRYWQNSGYAFTRVDYVFNEATFKSFNNLSEFISWISR
ncbi:MAG: hypothetical protein FGF52_03530 [Candidatus Brockarchaeota archaeon]|nr:hypothetical protein [Candidatus Brockarchaeota archaeon]